MAKVIAWGHDRDAARRRLLRALSEMEVEGVATTIPAIQAVLTEDDFIEARHSTRWLEERLDFSAVAAAPPLGGPPGGPEATAEGGRAAGTENMVLRDVDAEVDGRRYRVKLWVPDISAAGLPAPRTKRASATQRPRSAVPPISVDDGTVTVPMQGTIIKVLVTEGRGRRGRPDHLCARGHEDGEPDQRRQAGTVRELRVSVGDSLGAGDVVAVIELTSVTTTKAAKQQARTTIIDAGEMLIALVTDDPRPPGARLRGGAGVDLVCRGAQRWRLCRRAGSLRLADRVRRQRRERTAHGRDLRRV